MDHHTNRCPPACAPNFHAIQYLTLSSAPLSSLPVLPNSTLYCIVQGTWYCLEPRIISGLYIYEHRTVTVWKSFARAPVPVLVVSVSPKTPNQCTNRILPSHLSTPKLDIRMRWQRCPPCSDSEKISTLRMMHDVGVTLNLLAFFRTPLIAFKFTVVIRAAVVQYYQSSTKNIAFLFYFGENLK